MFFRIESNWEEQFDKDWVISLYLQKFNRWISEQNDKFLSNICIVGKPFFTRKFEGKIDGEQYSDIESFRVSDMWRLIMYGFDVGISEWTEHGRNELKWNSRICNCTGEHSEVEFNWLFGKSTNIYCKSLTQEEKTTSIGQLILSDKFRLN